MINNDIDLNLIFDSWYKTQLEWTNKLYTTKDFFYYENIIYSLLKNNDSRLLNEVYPFVRKKIPNLKDKVITIYIARLKKDISSKIKMVGVEIYEKVLSERFNNRLLNTYEEIIDEINRDNKACGYNTSNEEFIITEMLYNEYIDTKHGRFDKKNINILEDYFKSKGILLNNVDNQYNKYDLISISNDFNLTEIPYSPILYHYKIQSFVRFNEISRNLFHSLIKLKQTGEIKELALRPDYHFGEDKLGLSYLTEAIERGTIFNLTNFGKDSITKLYSNDYEDQLWIIIDDKNITFEEFLNDFIVYGESIVTQVVHAEYIIDDNIIYISHIDHEFIFYTLDEFEERKNNPRQKGNAKKRYKTFKVDNSRIPIVDKQDTNLFLIVLEEYFRNKDLIQEYFKSISASKIQ